jgi:hypothetical protein
MLFILLLFSLLILEVSGGGGSLAVTFEVPVRLDCAIFITYAFLEFMIMHDVEQHLSLLSISLKDVFEHRGSPMPGSSNLQPGESRTEAGAIMSASLFKSISFKFLNTIADNDYKPREVLILPITGIRGSAWDEHFPP